MCGTQRELVEVAAWPSDPVHTAWTSSPCKDCVSGATMTDLGSRRLIMGVLALVGIPPTLTVAPPCQPFQRKNENHPYKLHSFSLRMQGVVGCPPLVTEKLPLNLALGSNPATSSTGSSSVPGEGSPNERTHRALPT